MRIVGREEIEKCVMKHADSRKAPQAWMADVEAAKWSTPQDVRDRYSTVDFIRGGRAVFDIKGNDYRIDAHIGFNTGTVAVVRAGTHSDYDKWTF